MSDYNPNSYDRYGNPKGGFEPPDPDGKGPFVLLAILVLIGLVGGLLYFNGPPRNTETAQATRPVPTAPVTPGPAATPSPATPSPATPTTPTPSASGNPAPTNPPADSMK
jgi:hypothetical protein